MPGKKGLPKFPKIWVRSSSKPSDKALARLQKLSPDKTAEEEEMASGGKAEEASLQNVYKEVKQLKLEFSDLIKSALTNFTSQIEKKIEILAEDNKGIRQDMKKIEGAVFKIDSEMGKISTGLQNVSGLASQNETKITQQQKEIADLQKKIIYMEDSSRRANVKLINFDVQKASDLKQEVETWVNTITGAQPTQSSLDIERVHFVGNPRGKQPRPIIVKFASYVKKEEFTAACRANPQSLKSVQVFQDLSKETADWRKTMRPVTTLLIKNNLRYSWGHPVFLRIWKGTVQHRISTVEEGQDLLKRWNITDG